MTAPDVPVPAARPAEVRVLAGLAGAIVVAYALTTSLGGREATAVLTAPGGGGPVLLGAFHVLAHLALVLVAPVLALAAALLEALGRRPST